LQHNTIRQAFRASHDREVFARACDLCQNIKVLIQYQEGGYKHAKFIPREFFPQGESFAVPTLYWTFLHHTTYNLAKKQGQWKIVFVTAYEEMQRAQLL
jgi:hypothetical protein